MINLLKIVLLIIFSFLLYSFTNNYVKDNYIKEPQKFIAYEITKDGTINKNIFKNINLSFFNTDNDSNNFFIDSRNKSAFKLDKNNNLIWTYSLNTGDLHSFIPNNKTYLLTLRTQNLPSIIEVDSLGKVIWQSKIDHYPEIIKVLKNNNIALYDKRKKEYIEIDRNNSIQNKVINTFCNNVVDFNMIQNSNILFNCRNALVEVDSKGKIIKKSKFKQSTPDHSSFYIYKFDNGNYFLFNYKDSTLSFFNKTDLLINKISSSHFKHINKELPSINGSFIIICSIAGTD